MKYILKIEGGGAFGGMMGDDEGREAEITGLMIEADGLVLCSNTKMGGFMAMMSAMRGGGFNANPTDIKVLSGDDTEGLKGRIIARDTDLDLCWIRIDDEKAKGRTFAALDLKASATPALGDKLYAVQREGKFFDHALVVSEGRVGGKARKPRPLIIPSGIGIDLGMPAFNGEGKLLGVAVLQMPSREDDDGGDMSGMFGGFGGGMGMLLPAEEVARATERGKTLAGPDAKKADEGR
ncbi:MAG: serine protease [Phycisphaerales bacterium]